MEKRTCLNWHVFPFHTKMKPHSQKGSDQMQLCAVKNIDQIFPLWFDYELML